MFRIVRRLDDVITVAGNPFSQTSLPSPGPKTSRRATLRMPSDEALRFTLVCKLPLLHFTLSRVAVRQRRHRFQEFRFCASLPQSSCPKTTFPSGFYPGPSSSAPAFHLLVHHPLTWYPWMPGLVRVTPANSQLSQFLPWLMLPRLPFWTSSGLWAILSSDSNRLNLLRRLSSHARPSSDSAASSYL
jgi:hypothetical protein